MPELQPMCRALRLAGQRHSQNDDSQIMELVTALPQGLACEGSG